MMHEAGRTRVLCIRGHANPDCSPVLHAIVDEFIAALGLHGDVAVIEGDFDLVSAVERLKPDFLLFDALHWGRSHPPRIANSQAHPELPRALLLNSDPHDPMRPLTMDMVSAYGIDTIFCTGTEPLEQMKELRRFNCFVLPKFVDAAVFREYGEAMVIPFTIASAHLFPAFYPWRAKLTGELQHLMPTLLYTHPGYSSGAPDPFAIHGEAYARMLARSWFCAADTTCLDYVVRKHLEIPACGSVLVSPPSRALADYGFVDGENCLLGEAGTPLYERIAAIAREPDRYEEIRSKGHALVHARFTRVHWRYIFDWHACRKALAPGQMVEQQGIFGGFRAVPERGEGLPVARYVARDNPMAQRLRAAREALLGEGDLTQAARGLNEAMGWVGHVGEPWFMMGVISLALGEREAARDWLARRGRLQGSRDPALGLLDPCEIAWLLLLAYITADEDLLAQMLRGANGAPHVSVRRVLWLIEGTLPLDDLAEAGLERPRPGDVHSIHWLGDEDFDAWFGLVQRILARLCAEAGPVP